MQLPFTQLLGVASGAVGLVQKAFSHGSPKGNFDAELATALQGKTGQKNPLTELLAKKGLLDDESLKGLLGTPEGIFLFQFMTSLKQMGLQTSDIQLILNGNGAQISDDALKGILSQAGIGQKELDAILADPKVMADIKAQLSDSVKALFNFQAQKDGMDPDELLKLIATDSNAIDEAIQLVEAENQQALPAENDAGVQPVQAKKQGEQEMLMNLGHIQKNISHTTNEIRAMVALILKNSAHADTAAEASGMESGDPEISLKTDAAVNTAEKTLGISKDVLKDLFFSTDPVSRQQAVSQVTTQVNAYLKSQEGKPLTPEVANMLAFLKAGMSEQEFAGIDQSLKLLQPVDQSLVDSGLQVNKEMYTSLSKNLASNDAPAVFENHMKQVIDQLRQTLPSSMKNGEGQVTMRLHPPMLGKVEVSMTMQDGQLQALFKTDQAVTHDILVQNMNILKEALADQGIKATQFSVTMNFDSRSPRDGYAYAFSGQGKQGQGSGQNGRQPENSGRTYRENDGIVYAQANYSGLSDSGLDFFA